MSLCSFKKNKFYLSLVAGFLLSFLAFSIQAQNQAEVDTPFNKQTIPDKFQLRAALEAIKEGDYYLDGFRPNYDAALTAYEKAQEINPNNIDLNLKLGLCYLKSPTKDHINCLPFYEKALQLDPTVERYIAYYLGETYHRNRQWLKAIEYYEKDLKVLEDPEAIAITNKRIEECRNGIELSKRPVNIKIENLGKTVNSEFDEYGVVITADDSTMYFTSRRANTVGGIQDEDGKYYEDIYVSTKVGDEWTLPINMGTPINSKNNDAVAGISPNGNLMIIYREADLFYCKKDEETGRWTSPKAFPKQINTKYMEASAAFSVTGDTLYFTSDREDLSMGGLDIFYSIKTSEEGKENKWSDPINLGSTINTPYYEEGIFIHPEGHTLYFSSTGHNTMGGYDIFKCELENGKWGIPQNIGLPMNTPEDELYLSLSRSGRYGYYSSANKKDLTGEDIYRVTFLDVPEEVKEEAPTLRPLVIAFEENTQNAPINVETKGSIIDANTFFAGLKVNVFDEATQTPLVANVKLPTIDTEITTNPQGKAITLIASKEAASQVNFEAIKNGYAASNGIANLTQGNTETIEIPLKKLAAKQALLAEEIAQDILNPRISPSVAAIALQENAGFSPIKVVLEDDTNNVVIEKAVVECEFTHPDGTTSTITLAVKNGKANGIVPANTDYKVRAKAEGYIPKEINLAKGLRSDVTFRMKKRKAREVVAEVSVSTPLSIAILPTPQPVDLENEAVLVRLNKQVISNESNQVIRGATFKVKSTEAELSLTTNERGYAKTVLQQSNSYPISVRAEGYVAFSKTFTGEGLSGGSPIILMPKAERTLLTASVALQLNVPTLQPRLQNSALEEENEVAFFVSKILDAATKAPVQSDIQIVDKENNITLLKPTQRASNGAFFTHLPANQNLMIVVEAEAYLYHSENFRVNFGGNYELSGDAIYLKKVDVGESLTLNNVIFEVSSVDLMKSSFAELDRLANILKKNSTLKIEISGHTDYTRGRNVDGLVELSLLRAKSVKNYLVKQGIEAERMIEKGYGPSKPVVSNDDNELKYLNRRVEFEILSK